MNIDIGYRDSKTYWDNYPILYKGNYPMNRNVVEDEVDKYALGDASKARELLGWKAKISLEEGLQTLVDYAKEIS